MYGVSETHSAVADRGNQAEELLTEGGMSERMGTHWEGCEEVHEDCKIARLQAENVRLRTALQRIADWGCIEAKEWDGDVLIPEQNADLEWRVTEKNAARQRIIDALLSFSAQVKELEDALDKATHGRYSELMLRLADEVSSNRVDRREKVALAAQLKEKEAECAGLRADAACNRAALGFTFDAMVINSGNVGEIRDDWTLPMACQWNAWVRDLTAERENQPPRHPSDIDAAIDSARKESK